MLSSLKCQNISFHSVNAIGAFLKASALQKGDGILASFDWFFLKHSGVCKQGFINGNCVVTMYLRTILEIMKLIK